MDKQSDKQTKKGRKTAIWRDRRGGQKKRRKESQGEVGSKSNDLHWSNNFIKDNKDAKRGNKEKKKKRG